VTLILGKSKNFEVQTVVFAVGKCYIMVVTGTVKVKVTLFLWTPWSMWINSGLEV